MQRILLIKFTSLGDLIHALPALTDASRAIPSLVVDWMIDKSFAEVASWHPAVGRIYPTSHRAWMKNLRAAIRPVAALVREARKTDYDLIIDGQGNFKSALMSLCMKGTTSGFDRHSAREWVAGFAYHKKCSASLKAHAIERLRLLFSQSLGYPCPKTAPDFGIDRSRFSPLPFEAARRYLVFVHNASWKTKLWPEPNWARLLASCGEAGYTVYLPWGNEEEKERATRLGKVHPNGTLLPKLNLSEIGTLLLGASAAVCMDTGISHLAAALDVPTVTLYGATDSGLTGTHGGNQIHIRSARFCAPCSRKVCRFPGGALYPPCLGEITPEQVFRSLVSATGRRV